ncbi:MAG TPA: hypothetical protein VGS22_05265 [Thermoanaerobaculia bacterium]|jgi:hypothetical protein|nr:hypothetical protein [Thermoanaerobaculia bacterium]
MSIVEDALQSFIALLNRSLKIALRTAEKAVREIWRHLKQVIEALLHLLKTLLIFGFFPLLWMIGSELHCSGHQLIGWMLKLTGALGGVVFFFIYIFSVIRSFRHGQDEDSDSTVASTLMILFDLLMVIVFVSATNLGYNSCNPLVLQYQQATRRSFNLIPHSRKIISRRDLAYSPEFAREPIKEAWTVDYDGVGPVKIGMSLDDLSRAINQNLDAYSSVSDQDCFYLMPINNSGVGVMIRKGSVARIDVGSPEVSTTEGAHIGSTEKRIRSIYGSTLEIGPHQYDDHGLYLTNRSRSGDTAIRFEISEGLVSTYYVGKFPEITLVEHCL